MGEAEIASLPGWVCEKQGSPRVTTPSRVSGQEVLEISRVGLGRVGIVQEVFKLSRIGSGRVTLTRPDPTRHANFDPTREQSWIFFVASLNGCTRAVALKLSHRKAGFYANPI